MIDKFKLKAFQQWARGVNVACLFVGFMLFGGMAAMAQQSVQTQKVKMPKSQMSLRELFKTIERQSDFLFFYVDADIEGIIVSPPTDKPIAKVLDAVLKKHSLTYVVNDRNITISRKKDDAPAVQGQKDQKPAALRQVNGVVKDADSNPLIGAAVVVKNSSIGTVTDIEGNFSLSVPSDAVLLVSYVGFEPKEIKSGGVETSRSC